jgi:hypothetical protein
MERIQELIAKLREQADKQADVAQMLTTLQLIRDELTSLPQSGSYEQPATAESYRPAPRTLGTSKVAVVLPSTLKADPAYERYAPRPAAVAEPEPLVNEVKETVLVQKGSVSIVQENGQLDMVFDPMTEIPTLSQQVQNKKGLEPESLNDRLRQGKTELIEVLKETPVKDLRKAIGINDRFLFINDLFRGDESMYERSIKTINSFSIFPEAEYWINRELKVKLGWKIDDPAVLHFDQLIKRRFS